MSRDVLTSWHRLLAELGELGELLAAAIEGDDLLAAISAMMQLRRVRSELSRVEAPAGPGSLGADPVELRLLAEATALARKARATEAMMERWLARELPGDARLLGSPLGIAVLVDALLPPVWDFEADLVILVGAGLAPVAQLLVDLGQRRILVVGGDPAEAPAIAVASVEEVAAVVRTLVPGPPRQLAVRGALDADPEQVARVAERAREALSDLRIHRNTVRAFSRTWVEQGAANLPSLARWPSIAAIGDAFAGVPMVIIAPGPSLARNIDQVHALAGRAILAAFSHSLKPVLAAGITPDLVITVDPQDVRYHFAGCDVGRTCLVNAATVHPSLFELPAPRMLGLSANSAIDDWIFDGLDEDALVAGGGSVATSAFSLALRWGCDPIVFVGLDLSFPGGQYYVQTSSDGGARARIDERGVMRVEGWSDGFAAMKAGGGPELAAERAIELPGWHGGTVPSSFMFSLFHRWFVERLRLAGPTTVYNCTEGGAYIEGMIHRPLAEIAPALATPIDVAAVLDAAIARSDPEARRRRLAGHLGRYLHGLRRSRQLAARAAMAIARGETGATLERLERSLARALRPLGFVSLLAQREVDRAQDLARRTASSGDYLAASASLFATLGAVVDQLEPVLARALERLDQEPHGRAA